MSMGRILIFLLFLYISVSLYWIIIPKRFRSLFLLGCSIIFIAALNLEYLLYFLANVAFVYGAKTYIGKKAANKGWVLSATVVWLVANLCLFKYHDIFINLLSMFGVKFPPAQAAGIYSIVLPLGLSYIIFRLIHYVVESYRGNIPESSFVDFAMYVLFFPTFLAGPVDRFPRVYSQTAQGKDFVITDFNYGLFRIASGIIKKFLISDSLAKVIMPILYAPQANSRPVLIASIYGLAIQVYLDFAGYTDMAIGISRLFGYTIMENFDRPFLKKNIALFWRSWHISVYSWIRDYFFFPIFGYKASNFKIYLGIFCSMMVFMLWHKGNINFLLLGIYHGTGLIAWYLFQEVKRKHLFIRNLFARPYLDPLSVFVTFNFVSFGFIIFSLNLHEINMLLRRLL